MDTPPELSRNFIASIIEFTVKHERIDKEVGKIRIFGNILSLGGVYQGYTESTHDITFKYYQPKTINFFFFYTVSVSIP